MRSLGVSLSEDQIGALDECVDNFRDAKYKGREEIVQDFLHDFVDNWPEDTEDIEDFNLKVKTVCVPFSTLGCSHTFLAYSPAPLRQIKTTDRHAHSKKPTSNGRRKVRMPFTRRYRH